jgi:hypothetical protein
MNLTNFSTTPSMSELRCFSAKYSDLSTSH